MGDVTPIRAQEAPTTPEDVVPAAAFQAVLETMVRYGNAVSDLEAAVAHLSVVVEALSEEVAILGSRLATVEAQVPTPA